MVEFNVFTRTGTKNSSPYKPRITTRSTMAVLCCRENINHFKLPVPAHSLYSALLKYVSIVYYNFSWKYFKNRQHLESCILDDK